MERDTPYIGPARVFEFGRECRSATGVRDAADERNRPPMGHLWTGFRAAVYATAFFALWYYIAISIEPLDAEMGLRLPQWTFLLGLWIMGLGAILALVCVSTFVHRGRGTPAPFDPPRRFVATGPYRAVRNPMYVGGLMVFLGFGLMERSVAITFLAFVVSIGLHFFVVLVEEPVLERRFGESYMKYKRLTPRWIPRRRVELASDKDQSDQFGSQFDSNV